MQKTRLRAVIAIVAAATIGLTTVPQAAYAATWTRTAKYERWTGFNALERGQGIANDGTYFYYSGLMSMVKTRISDDHEVAENNFAIPADLSNTFKSNHIGDIAYHDGLVVAPLEDGKNGYQNPLLALYDANNLNYTGRYVKLPLDSLPGGVPWVAVDAAAGLVWVAPWTQRAEEGTDRLIAYRLNDLLTAAPGATLAVDHTVKLSRPLSRIQGATMYNGELYASVDISGDKSVYSINTVTGAVNWQFKQDVEPKDEVQGITAVDLGPTGGQLHVLNVGSGLKSIFMYLQHYTVSGQ
ncbi:hypothetical protein M2390_002105 [Mycetocola sp. BIGb0189]|uniref:hypothetical protein n=1 Tax=Mycetocola sp. BIGb0189 TaxID=2940604 RepID=UPI002168B922|nr:hypothetical protein [Mycetocola sp. BIGb0189]MCS4276911.1 hypothetical protein [Mycetocola sp. BIGb0189]